jgi:hypothetical protein
MLRHSPTKPKAVCCAGAVCPEQEIVLIGSIFVDTLPFSLTMP